MSLPSGFVLKDSHLIRGVAALVVISVLVPGIFGVGPPQYFGDDDTRLAALQQPDEAPPTPTPTPDMPAPDMPAAEIKTAQTDGAAKLEEPAVPARVPPADAAPGDISAKDSVTKDSGTADETSPETSQVPSQTEIASANPTPETEQPPATDPAEAVSQTAGEAEKDEDKTTQPAPLATAAQTQAETRSATGAITRAEIQQTIASLKPGAPVAAEEPAVRATKKGTDRDTVEVASLQRTAKLPPPNDPLKPFIVARTFHKRIAESHLELPVKKQKDAFIGMLLPLVLAANDEIAQRRQAIMRAAGNNDTTSLEKWARLYRINISDRSLDWVEDELLRRADAIPVSLALAQGAIESGWGTSRFALQGNALFGQWAWDQSAGLKPIEASNSRAVVRSFPNLFGSVRAYMHNLNTHTQYARFRERRDLLRGRKRNDLGMQLSVFLDGYAEIGMAYVDKIQTIIRINDLGRYEAARLQ